jgi:hypothetical protein
LSQFNPGDLVSLLPPFSDFFPGQYLVESWDDGGNAMIEGGRGFSDDYLQLVAVGSGVAPAAGPAPVTRYAFQNRFTLAELVTIDMASIDDPSADPSMRQLAATLRVEQRKLDLAKFIDLTDPQTVAGTQQLEAYGLIGSGRAAQILSTVITPDEAA